MLVEHDSQPFPLTVKSSPFGVFYAFLSLWAILCLLVFLSMSYAKIE